MAHETLPARSPDEYRRRAEACRFAAGGLSGALRDQLLQFARIWDAFAEQAPRRDLHLVETHRSATRLFA